MAAGADPLPRLAGLAVAGLLLAASPARGAGEGWRGSVELGYDSFAQRYRLTDLPRSDALSSEPTSRDTTDVFSELRARGELGWSGQVGAWRWGGEGELSVGSELDRGRLGLLGRFEPVAGRSRVDLELEADGRRFRESSDFRLSSDQANWGARLRGRHRAGEALTLLAGGRARRLRHERPDVYQLDEDRGELELGLRVEEGYESSFDLRGGLGRRVYPDSAAISRDDRWVEGEFHRAVGLAGGLRLLARAERRRYDDPSVRSALWDYLLELELELALAGPWALRASAPLEWLEYDDDQLSEVFEDSGFGRLGLALLHRRGSLELGLEPRWSFQRTPGDPADSWAQPSAVARLRWMRPGGWWIDLRGEFGHRAYGEGGGDEIALTTSYTFVRTTLLLSVPLRPSLSLDGYLSDEPEFHGRDEDDSRLTLATVSVRARF